MKLLLDTHAFMWAALDHPRLGRQARRAIIDPGNIVLISAAIAWEIAIKWALGRPTMSSEQVDASITARGFVELPVSIAHANRVGHLPFHHRDPFDRMLAAQAQAEGALLVTHDRAFRDYDLEVLWC